MDKQARLREVVRNLRSVADRLERGEDIQVFVLGWYEEGKGTFEVDLCASEGDLDDIFENIRAAVGPGRRVEN